MADNKERQTATIVCPYCGTASAGAFSTVVKRDEAGPTEVLYKCHSCGRFYTAERVISWQVKKG